MDMIAEMDWVLVPAGGVLGLLIGSFIGAVSMRLPRGEGIVAGRSHCDLCGEQLRIADLVPVLSHLVARGRCRHCGGKIDSQHLIAEFGGAFVGAAAMAAGETLADGALIAIMGWQLLLLALLDARHFWLPAPAIALLGVSSALVPLEAWWSGGDVLVSLLGQLAGGGLGFALLAAPALIYRAVRGRDGMGRADPWLLGAIGLWTGAMGAVFTLLLAAFAGLVLALFLKIAGRDVDVQSALPLGTLMALAAYALMVASRVPLVS